MSIILANQKTVKIIDYTIFSFLLIFIASLTNSIFVNQLGYYGALIFLLIRYAVTKKNPFTKTGIEIPLLLFIAAEILSTVFSLNQHQAFQNLLKRILLLPVIYTIIAGVVDTERAKLLFKTYIGFAVISCLIYLYIAYDYWIYNQFSITESGPSVFNYPITAGELISFTIIFLFAFIINEKKDFKYLLLNITLFLITSLALISTYKRTGWIGTAAGILAILIVNKQWKVIGIGTVAVIALFLFEKNISVYSIYTVEENQIKNVSSMETDGRPFDVIAEDSMVFVSDFENGLLIFDNEKLVNKLEISGAINKFRKWKNDYYVASLADSRFLLYKRISSTEFKFLDEFISPGYVNNFEIENDFIYVNDSDSGLTIFRNPEELADTVRFPFINNNKIVRVDSARLFCYSNIHGIRIFNMKNYLPGKEIFSSAPIAEASTVDFINDKIFVSNKSGAEIFGYSQNNLIKIDSTGKLNNIYLLQQGEYNYYMSGFAKKIFVVNIDSTGKINVLSESSTNELITSISENSKRLYTTTVKEGRLKSIIDPNKPSNFVRFALWRAGWLIFKDYPLFGVGDIDLAFLYKQYKRNYDKEIQGHLHNNFVHLLVILGGFGFVVVIFLLIKIFMLNLKIYAALKPTPFLSSFALGTIGVFVSFLVAGLTEWNFGDHEIITMIWFVTGLNFAFYKLNSSKDV